MTATTNENTKDTKDNKDTKENNQRLAELARQMFLQLKREVTPMDALLVIKTILAMLVRHGGISIDLINSFMRMNERERAMIESKSESKSESK